MAPQGVAPLISTPVAIVAAGALVGLGLFFGLRSGPEAVAPSAGTPPVPGALSAPPPATVVLGPGPSPTPSAPPPAPTATAAVDTKAVASLLKAALDQHKKVIVEQCLTPSLAKQPTPASVNLTFNFSLDANGKQLTRGISEDRETSRPDVTQCVQTKLPPLAVAAPGAGVFVEGIVWTLP